MTDKSDSNEKNKRKIKSQSKNKDESVKNIETEDMIKEIVK